MATETTLTEIDRQRIRDLTEREEKRLDERTPGSRAMFERARETLVGGVASSYQLRDPYPLYVSHGRGPRIWDVDDNELLDFHNGFGSMVQGHAHPVIERGGAGALRARHALRGADRGRDRGRGRAPAPLRTAQMAVHELGLRGDHGRDPDRARGHRPRHDRQDLRLLPRPPRLRDGLDRRPLRRDRRPGELRLAPLRRRHSPGGRRPDDRRPLQRRAPRWSGASSA